MAESEINTEGVNGIKFQMKDVVSQRSELMQEIVSDRPGFLIRWGNVFFLMVLVLIAVACWFIKYPDIIQATAKLTSIHAPKSVVCRSDGKLIKLLVEENQMVDKYQVLGLIESTADHQEILALASKLDSVHALLNTSRDDQINIYLAPTPAKLGELQSAYQTFSQAYLVYGNYLEKGFYLHMRTILLKDKSNLIKLNENLLRQKELHEQHLVLTEKTFKANESLNKEKVISDFDYRIEESKLINKQMTLPQIKSSVISNETQQAEKEKQIIELDNTIKQQKLIFQQALHTFKSQLDEWIRRYVFMAPTAGRIAFATFLQENQQLQANQVICYVNPQNSQYYAEVNIPQSNFGKVAIGQQVLLKFQSYSKIMAGSGSNCTTKEFSKLTSIFKQHINKRAESSRVSAVAVLEDLYQEIMVGAMPYITSAQTTYIGEIRDVLASQSHDINLLQASLTSIEQRAYSLPADEQSVVLSAISIGRNSAEYWSTNYLNWQAEFNQSAEDLSGDRVIWGVVAGCDLAAGVGTAAGAYFLAAVPFTWGFYGALVGGVALLSSGNAAIIMALN